MRASRRLPLLALVGLLGVLCSCVTNGRPQEDTASASSPELPPPSPSPLPVTEPGEVEVRVQLSEWLVAPEQAVAIPGPVTFDVKNAGLIPHQLVVYRTELEPDDLGIVGGRADRRAAMSSASTGALMPGERERLALILAPGSYVLLCNLPAHYEAGMRTALLVEAPDSP